MGLCCLEICRAACCQDIKIQLTKPEYEDLKRKGARLWETWEDGIYRMDGPCPNLSGGECVAYYTGERPEVCRRFWFLGFDCRDRRRAHPQLVKFYLPGEAELGFELGKELRFAAALVMGAWFFTEPGK